MLGNWARKLRKDDQQDNAGPAWAELLRQERLLNDEAPASARSRKDKASVAVVHELAGARGRTAHADLGEPAEPQPLNRREAAKPVRPTIIERAATQPALDREPVEAAPPATGATQEPASAPQSEAAPAVPPAIIAPAAEAATAPKSIPPVAIERQASAPAPLPETEPAPTSSVAATAPEKLAVAQGHESAAPVEAEQPAAPMPRNWQAAPPATPGEIEPPAQLLPPKVAASAESRQAAPLPQAAQPLVLREAAPAQDRAPAITEQAAQASLDFDAPQKNPPTAAAPEAPQAFIPTMPPKRMEPAEIIGQPAAPAPTLQASAKAAEPTPQPILNREIPASAPSADIVAQAPKPAFQHPTPMNAQPGETARLAPQPAVDRAAPAQSGQAETTPQTPQSPPSREAPRAQPPVEYERQKPQAAPSHDAPASVARPAVAPPPALTREPPMSVRPAAIERQAPQAAAPSSVPPAAGNRPAPQQAPTRATSAPVRSVNPEPSKRQLANEAQPQAAAQRTPAQKAPQSPSYLRRSFERWCDAFEQRRRAWLRARHLPYRSTGRRIPSAVDALAGTRQISAGLLSGASKLWRRADKNATPLAPADPMVCSAAPDPIPIPTDTRNLIRAGVLIIGVFFGGGGLWAALAPINKGAYADGTVTVETERKDVQHLEGGIVKQILAKDGDEVQEGQILVRLDDTKAAAELGILQDQYLTALASAAALAAEQVDSPIITFPPELLDQQDNPKIASIINGQTLLNKARRAHLDDQIQQLHERIRQSQEEIKHLESQTAAEDREKKAYQEQIGDVTFLLQKGYEKKPNLLNLQRSLAMNEATRSATGADIARANQRIAESAQNIAQLKADSLSEVARDLKATQSQIFELRDRIAVAKDTLSRLEIRAPRDGVVIGSHIHAPGAVISPGQTVLSIVPSDDRLIVEAHLETKHIDMVHAGVPAEVRLLAYSQRRTPMIDGKVIDVSADAIQPKADSQSNSANSGTSQSYYLVKVALDAKEMAALPDVKLEPGMPAQVMIDAGARTAAEYLFDPLLIGFHKAFREH